jgi:hypothetical protein
VVTSNRIGWPLSVNLKLRLREDGNDQFLGWLEAAISKLRPYDLMASETMTAVMISEAPQMSATIMDVVFIECRAVNVPAHRRRANGVRLLNQTRSRRSVQPACSLSKSS